MIFNLRLQQAQLLRRRVAMMNTRVANASAMSNVTTTTTPSSSNIAGPSLSPAQPSQSPVAAICNLGSPIQQPNMVGKPGAQTPPANVLQVVKQVNLIKIKTLVDIIC